MFVYFVSIVPDDGVPPAITSQPESSVAIVGLNISLECRVALNHDLPYTINWLKDGEVSIKPGLAWVVLS